MIGILNDDSGSTETHTASVAEQQQHNGESSLSHGRPRERLRHHHHHRPPTVAGGGEERGRERRRRHQKRSSRSRSPSESPPGSCPIGCATMYYALWIILGWMLLDQSKLGLHEHGNVAINGDGGGSASIQMKQQQQQQQKSQESYDSRQRLKEQLNSFRLEIPFFDSHSDTSDNTNNSLESSSSLKDSSSRSSGKNTTSSRDNPQRNCDNDHHRHHTLQFLFFAGLPGPGHDIIRHLIDESPIIKPTLKELNIILNDDDDVVHDDHETHGFAAAAAAAVNDDNNSNANKSSSTTTTSSSKNDSHNKNNNNNNDNDHIQNLQELLWGRTSSSSKERKMGLWNAHCSMSENEQQQPTKVSGNNLSHTTILDDLVNELKMIQTLHDNYYYYDDDDDDSTTGSKRHWKANHSSLHPPPTSINITTTTTTTRIPINLLSSSSSYMSFPNTKINANDYFLNNNDIMDPPLNTEGKATKTPSNNNMMLFQPRTRTTKPCPLEYPNLDMLFTACNIAHVDCRLVYVHHHPPPSHLQHMLQHLLQATTTTTMTTMTTSSSNRPTRLLPSIHLLTTMISILSADIFLHWNNVITCLDMNDVYDENKSSSSSSSSSSSASSSTATPTLSPSWNDILFHLLWTTTPEIQSTHINDNGETPVDTTTTTTTSSTTVESRSVGGGDGRHDEVMSNRRKEFERLVSSLIKSFAANTVDSSHDSTQQSIPISQLENIEPYINAFELSTSRILKICQESIKAQQNNTNQR